jgi:GT2 family glycosyltransferase
MSRPSATDLSVVIVSWNCQAFLRKCLARLRASRVWLELQIIVVDNGSSDGSPEMVEAEFPEATLLRAGANLGFAAGNNLGLQMVHGRYVLLLNPDAFIEEKGLLELLIDWLEGHPQFGALGCRLIFPDGTHQVGDAGYRPTAQALVASALGLPRLSPRFRGVFLPWLPARSRRPVEVDWVCGAFLLMRREMLDCVGGLDESFFLYGEDVEWGCRARTRGVRIAYLPWKSVIHVQSGAQYKDGRATVSTRWLDSLVQLHRRLEGDNALPRLRLYLTFGFALRATLYRIAALLLRQPRLANKSRAMRLFRRHCWSTLRG